MSEQSPWQTRPLRRTVQAPLRRRGRSAIDRRVVARVLILAALAILVLGCQLQATRLRGGASLAESMSLLLAGDRGAALTLLESSSLPPWSSGCGRALRGLATGNAVADLRACRGRRHRALPWPLLVHRLLHDGRAEQALRALELARPARGSAVLADLERRARAELLATRGGTVRRVYDRMGRALGEIEQDRWSLSPAASEIGLGDWLRPYLGDLPATAGVRLSLDLELSRALQEALGGERGSVVVFDLVNGGVVAATSDRSTLREGPAFLDQAREPASIAKLITTSAALRAGIDVDGELMDFRCGGSVALSDGALYCPAVLGRVRGLDRALAASCNTSFATLGLRVGREALVDEYRRFGFLVAGEAGGEGAGARLRSAIGTDREVAELAIGLNHAELTPLHAARMAALLGTGTWLPLRFVLAGDGAAGRSPRFLEPAERVRVLEAPVVERLGQALLAVTRFGTLAGAAPPGYAVAMKTGTASEPEHGFHVNYIGYAPWPEPRLAFALRITDRATSRAVRRSALPVTTRVLRVLEQRGEEPLALRYGRRAAA